MQTWQMYCGDALSVLKTLPDGCVHCVVSSPPYWGLRNYGVEGQLGLERTPVEYVAAMVAVFAEVRRVLADDGTVFGNWGDTYIGGGRGGIPEESEFRKQATNAGSFVERTAIPNGYKAKDLAGIPWSVAFALRSDGWYLRSDIIWCLSGGARVYARTQKGDMPMMVKDLVRLDPATVKLWNGEKWTQALGWSHSPEARDGSLEIELRSGERIGCTVGHVWPTQRGNVRADELVVGDSIRTTQLPGPEREVNPSALDDEVAWLCGLYLAEGSMNGDAVQITGHANETADRLTRLERIAAAFHCSTRVHISGNVGNIVLNGWLIQAVVQTYVHGTSSKNKGIKVRAWQRGQSFLRNVLQGYLDGDGHYDTQNDRWRLSFTRNDRLAADLRTLAARLGLSIRLATCTVTGFGREWPAYRGDIRLTSAEHHNVRDGGEVVAIRASRAREFWDIGVEDEPHLFALASGVLTHNSKKSCMPESVKDRPTKSHEYVFLLSKRPKYFYNADAIREKYAESTLEQIEAGYDGEGQKDYATAGVQNPSSVKARIVQSAKMRDTPRNDGDRWRTVDGGVAPRGGGANARSVWSLGPEPATDIDHFAVMPKTLARRCILAGSPFGGTILDPFAGSGTTGIVALEEGRNFIGIELNPKYYAMARERLQNVAPLLAQEVSA